MASQIEKSSEDRHLDYSAQTRKALDSFYDFVEALEPFKHASLDERKQLTKALNSNDVGYLISFLNAVYKPNQFDSWIALSSYTPKRPGTLNRDKK